MKNLFVFLMMVLVVPVLRAQHFKKVMKPAMNNRLKDAAPDRQGGFYVLGKQGGPNTLLGEVRLYHLNASADTLWSALLPFAPQTSIVDMLVLDDGDVVISGTQFECDIDLDQFITRIDANGNTLWLNTYVRFNDADSLNRFWTSEMTLTGDGNVYMFGLGKVYVIDLTTGEKVHQFSLPFDFFFDYYNFYYHVYENELYFTGSPGIRGYQLQTGVQTQYLETDYLGPNYEGVFSLDQNRTIFIRDDGESAVLHTDGTISFPDLGVVTFLDGHPDGRLAVFGGGSVRIYAGDGTLLSSFEPELHGLFPGSIFWLDSMIVLAGEEKHLPEFFYYTSSLWMQSFDIHGNTIQNSSDASLYEIVIDEQPIARDIQATSWPADYTLSGGQFSARVFNNGDDVLQTVTLNAAYYGYSYYGICSDYGRLYTTYTNLNLAPGKDTLLYSGTIERVESDTSQVSLQPWQFCIWTSDPNHQADADISNNRSCVEIMLNLLPEPEPNPDAFSLFPNPTTDACTITWGENLRPETVRVYDLLGRLMRTESVDASSGRHELDLAGLIRGLYVVELGGVVVRVARL